MTRNDGRATQDAIETMVQLGFELLSVLPGAYRRDDGSAIVINTRVPVALFNGVFKVRWDEASCESQIERYVEEFSKTRTPFMVHVYEGVSTPARAPEALKARGFRPESLSTMFTMELNEVPSGAASPLPENVSVRRVSSWAEVADYMKVFVPGFSLPAAIADAFDLFFKAYGFDESKTFQSLVLYEGDKPVAIASVLGNRNALGELGPHGTLPADLCTMMNLTVLPEARGRGHGIRMAIEAVKFALGCGYGRLCTTGTPEGMAVYRKAPLREVGKCRRWTFSSASGANT